MQILGYILILEFVIILLIFTNVKFVIPTLVFILLVLLVVVLAQLPAITHADILQKSNLILHRRTNPKLTFRFFLLLYLFLLLSLIGFLLFLDELLSNQLLLAVISIYVIVNCYCCCELIHSKGYLSISPFSDDPLFRNRLNCLQSSQDRLFNLLGADIVIQFQLLFQQLLFHEHLYFLASNLVLIQRSI
jgi:hypothetical protein